MSKEGEGIRLDETRAAIHNQGIGKTEKKIAGASKETGDPHVPMQLRVGRNARKGGSVKVQKQTRPRLLEICYGGRTVPQA